MPANVEWRWKAGAYQHATGSSTSKSSPQAAFDELGYTPPLKAMECGLFLTSKYGTDSLTRAIEAVPTMYTMPIASSQSESVPSPCLFWHPGGMGQQYQFRPRS